MLADKIEERIEDLDTYIVAVSFQTKDGGHDCEIRIDGDCIVQMGMMAAMVKIISDNVDRTQDEVLDDLRTLIHEVEREENEQ